MPFPLPVAPAVDAVTATEYVPRRSRRFIFIFTVATPLAFVVAERVLTPPPGSVIENFTVAPLIGVAPCVTVAVIENVPPFPETATPTVNGADEKTVTVPAAEPPPALPRVARALNDEEPDADAGGVSVTVALPVAPGLRVIAGTFDQPLQL